MYLVSIIGHRNEINAEMQQIFHRQMPIKSWFEDLKPVLDIVYFHIHLAWNKLGTGCLGSGSTNLVHYIRINRVVSGEVIEMPSDMMIPLPYT